MTSKHIINCPSCFKIFKKNKCYEKHIFQCQRLHEEKIPNNIELLNMIIQITDKYNLVQTELQTLKGQICIQNKKLNILEWLNNQEKTTLSSWNNIMDSFEINLSDLELIFEKGLINGTFDIIVQYLQSFNFNSNEIIRCFNQNKNTLYVFNDEWQILNKSDFENIFKTIYQKILCIFNKYKDFNKEKLLLNDDFQLNFNNNFIKILCVQISFENQCVRIKNKLFNELKENFKSIIELENIN